MNFLAAARTLFVDEMRAYSSFAREVEVARALYVNADVVAEGEMRSQFGKFTLSGDGLCIGHDSGDAVSEDCQSPGTFTGGTVLFVAVTVEEAQYLDLEKLAAGAFAVD